MCWYITALPQCMLYLLAKYVLVHHSFTTVYAVPSYQACVDTSQLYYTACCTFQLSTCWYIIATMYAVPTISMCVDTPWHSHNVCVVPSSPVCVATSQPNYIVCCTFQDPDASQLYYSVCCIYSLTAICAGTSCLGMLCLSTLICANTCIIALLQCIHTVH